MEFKTVRVADLSGNVMKNADVRVYRANTTTEVTVFDENGVTLTTAQLKTDANGAFGFKTFNGVYDIVASLGSTTATVQNVQFNDPPSYTTVAAFFADIDAGYTAPDGTVASAGPVQFQADSSAAIDGLPVGWVPFGGWTGNHFGMIADGVDTGSAFTGTDNKTALQAAVNAASAAKQPLDFSAGAYKFSPAAVGVTDAYVIEAPTYVHLVMHGVSFYVDDDLDQMGKNPRHLFRTPGNSTEIAPGSLYDLFKIDGGEFRGRWSHGGVPDDNTLGQNFFRLAGYKAVEVSGVTITDCRGKVFVSGAIGSGYVRDCHFERIVSDACRFVNSSGFDVSDNYFKDTADDAVALHSRDNSTLLNPTPTALSCTNNTFISCESVKILGPHGTVVSGNKFYRTTGTGLAVGQSAAPEGSASQVGIVVTDNIVMDSLASYSESTGWGANLNQNGACVIGGASVIGDVGEWDGTSVVNDPRGDGTDAGPMWSNDWADEGFDATLADSAGSRGIKFSDNVIMRTLPAVTKYSDWGFGSFFARTGFVDPAVTDANFKTSAISVWSDCFGAQVTDNHIEGYRNGYCVWLFVTGKGGAVKSAFRSLRIAGNTFVDFFKAISSNRQGNGTPEPIDAVVEGNSFDGDPFLKQATRTSPLDGSWASTTDSAAQTSMNLNGFSGWIVRNNSHRNVYLPIVPSSQSGLAVLATVVGEVIACDPAGIGYSASNKGVAYIQPAGPSYIYKIEDSDPTSADWRKLKNTCPLYSGAMPAAGTWVQGHTVEKSNPVISGGATITGWRRITTGSGNVLNTDWVETNSRADGIHSSGAGVDSTWVRFTDGTQIATKSFLVLAYKNTALVDATWEFPMPFSTAPAISGSIQMNQALTGATPPLDDLLGVNHSTTGVNGPEVEAKIDVYRVKGGTNFAPGDTIPVRLMAIGRWL